MRKLQHSVSAKVARVMAAGAVMVMMANFLVSSRPAGADPAAASAYAGVGSDTIQDLFNAWSGAEPYPPAGTTTYYTPISPAAGGHKTITSWDAVPAGGSATAPGCIISKYGGGSFDRPNGSGNGRKALSHAIDGTAWFATTASCTGSGAPAGNVTGQVDFARSSGGPSTSGCTTLPNPAPPAQDLCLNFIPLVRDAVSFAFFSKNGTANISTLTTAQLNSLYSSATGTITVGADTVKACLPQSGSGTRAFWETAIGVTDSQANTAANAASCNGQEENGANTFETTAAAFGAGMDAVIPFSAGSFISQLNGAATDRSSTGVAAGVDLGAIDALGKPYSGTITTPPPNTPPLTPNLTFYASSQYGRDLYVVISTQRCGTVCVNQAATLGDIGLKGLFVGSTAAMCAAGPQSTAKLFGFATFADLIAGGFTASTCGDVTLTHGGKQGNLYT